MKSTTILLLIKVFLTLFVVVFVPSIKCLTVSIATSPTTVSTVGAILTLTLNLGSGNLATGDYFTLSVPSPASFTATTTQTKCILKTPAGAVTTCAITSTTATLHVSITGASNTFTIFTVANFNNPPSSTPLSIVISRFNSAGTLLESATGTLASVSPAQMASNTITALNQQIGATQTTIQFKFVNTNILTANGGIKVLFPLWNPSDVANNQLQMITTSAPTCTGIQNLNPSSCIYNTANQYLTLYNVVSADTSAGTTFQFSVSNILNPYSAKPKTGFTVTTLDSIGGSIDQDSSATLTVTTAASFSKLQLQLGSSTIGATTSYTFTYQVNLPIDANCLMKIVGPSQLDMNSYFQMVQGYSVFSSASTTAYATSSDNSVTIPGCNSYYGQVSNTDLLEVDYVGNPGEVMDTSKFIMYLYALSGTTQYIVAQDLVTLYVQKSQLAAGTITNLAVSATTDSIVQEATSYTISFTPSDGLQAASKVIINFPTSDAYFKLVSTTACTLSSVSGGLVTNPTTCTIASNTITITYPFGTATTYSGGTPLTFTIASGVNPTSVKDAGTFIFNTYNTISGSDYQVDSGSGSGLFTPLIGTITKNLAVTSTSYVTGAGPVTYTVQFSPTHTIPKNGILQLTIPISSIPVYSSATLLSQVYVATDSNSYVTCSSVTYSSGVLKISDAFTGSLWTPLVTGTYLTIKIGGLQNPRSLAQSGSFQVLTEDPSGYSIDQVTNGLQITMTSLNQLNSVSVTPASLINGAITTYAVAVTVQTPLINTDQFTITFPNTVTLPNVPSCTTSTMVTTVTCVKNGQTITASFVFLGGSVASGSNFAFNVLSVQNPPDTRPSAVFTNIYATDSSGVDISQYTTKTLNIVTTTAATITSSSLYQSSQLASSAATYTLSVTTINPMPANGAFVVSYISAVSASAITTCQVIISGVSYPMSCTLNTNAEKITLTGGSLPIIAAGTLVQIAVGPIVNPALGYTGTSSLSVSSYTDATTTYIVDTASTNMVPGLICSDPCKTCTVSSKTTCTSCFTDGSTIYEYLYGSSCVQQCPTGYYADSNDICQKCNSKCLTCVDANTCATCDTSTSSNYKYFTSNTCATTCPANTYSSNYVCSSCVSPCNTCTGPTNGQCLTCLISYSNSFQYQYGANCLTTCPSGYVPVNYICSKCNSPCLTCTINQDVCLTCVTGYYIYGTTCVKTCPTGYVTNYLTMTCVGCDPKCSACVGSSSVCTVCKTGFILYNNVCYSQCPTGYVLTSDKTTCQIIVITNTTTATTTTTTTSNTTNTTTKTNTTANTTITTTSSTTVTSSLANGYYYLDLGFLIYFPFLILCTIGFLISLGSYLKFKQSLIVSNSIALWGPIEFFALVAQIFLAAFTEQTQLTHLLGFSLFGTSSSGRRLVEQKYMLTGSSEISYAYPIVLLATAFALVMLIFVNVLFSCIMCCHNSIRNDPQFKEWRKKHKSSYCCIYTWATLLSFKIGKFLYSRFFAYKSCNADFKKVKSYYSAMNSLSIMNIFFSLLPVIFIDIWALTLYKWGTQFFISLIETLVISLLMLIFIILDFRVHVKDDESAKKVMNDSALDQLKINDFSNIIDKKFSEHKQWMEKEKILLTPGSRSNMQFHDNDAYNDYDDEKSQRKEAIENLKQQMMMPKNKIPPSQFRQDKMLSRQSEIHSNLRKRRNSDQPEEAEKETIEEGSIPYSYPASPRAYSDYNNAHVNVSSSHNDIQKSKSSPILKYHDQNDEHVETNDDISIQQEIKPKGRAKQESIRKSQYIASQQESVPQKRQETNLGQLQSEKSSLKKSMLSNVDPRISQQAFQQQQTIISEKSIKESVAQSRTSSQLRLRQRPPSENDNKWVQKHIYETPDEIKAESNLTDPQIQQVKNDLLSQNSKSNKDLSVDPKAKGTPQKQHALMASPSQKEYIVPQPDDEDLNFRNDKKKKAGRGKKDNYDNMVDDECQLLMDQENQFDTMQNELAEKDEDSAEDALREEDYLDTDRNGDDLNGTGTNLLASLKGGGSSNYSKSQNSDLNLISKESYEKDDDRKQPKNQSKISAYEKKSQQPIIFDQQRDRSQLSKKQVSFLDHNYHGGQHSSEHSKDKSQLEEGTIEQNIESQQSSQPTLDGLPIDLVEDEKEHSLLSNQQLSFKELNKNGLRPQTQQANVRANNIIGIKSQKSSAHDPTNNSQEMSFKGIHQHGGAPSVDMMSDTIGQQTVQSNKKDGTQLSQNSDTIRQNESALTLKEREDVLSEQTRQRKQTEMRNDADTIKEQDRRTSMRQPTKMGQQIDKGIQRENLLSGGTMKTGGLTAPLYDDSKTIQEQELQLETYSDIREGDLEHIAEENKNDDEQFQEATEMASQHLITGKSELDNQSEAYQQTEQDNNELISIINQKEDEVEKLKEGKNVDENDSSVSKQSNKGDNNGDKHNYVIEGDEEEVLKGENVMQEKKDEQNNRQQVSESELMDYKLEEIERENDNNSYLRQDEGDQQQYTSESFDNQAAAIQRSSEMVQSRMESDTEEQIMHTSHHNEVAGSNNKSGLSKAQSSEMEKISQQNVLDEEEEERRIIEEMRGNGHSQLANLNNDVQMLSKLSRYEKELNINQDDDEEEEDDKYREELQANHNKSSNLQLDQQTADALQEGRITTMMKNFENENPNLIINDEEELPPASPQQHIMARAESDLLQSPQSSQHRLSPMPIDVPPNPNNRNFNENDVLGDFDRDEKGSLILLENKKNQIVDKKGRLVNEKGYLVNGQNGDVVDVQKGRKMFTKSQLDDLGELPAPFNLEKYNFNPLEILGYLDFDAANGKPQNLKETRNGGFHDQLKRDVNRSGFMVDKDGNLIDRNGRKKFDRRLLAKHDNLPNLLNFKGRKFDIKDVIGEFERDPKTGDALIKRDKQGVLRDKHGKPVNQRGYLVDPEGNIVDKKNNKIFDKYSLSKNGEFPKIFPFSKFNIGSITGDFEVDPLGNPMLSKDSKNPKILRDTRGRRVNQLGYLIDDDGNVIDKNGNKVFNKQILSSTEDIPKVFRKGILRRDTQDSFSRIMSEIEDLERRQESDYEGNYFPPGQRANPPQRNSQQQQQQQQQFNQQQQNNEKWEGGSSGGNTSIESQMEDTPSNYNIPNQRFDHNYYEVDEIVEDSKEAKFDDMGKRIFRGGKIKQKKLKKRKPQVPRDNPTYIKSDRDAMMGVAYGENRDKKGQIPKWQNNQNQITQSKLSHLAQSISGFYKDPDRNHDGLSSRMKESETARKIPNFKDRQQLKRRDSNEQIGSFDMGGGNAHHGDSQSSHKSMLSLYGQSNNNFNQMMSMAGRQGQPGMSSRRRLNGMETIYLQRLEPTAGKPVKKGTGRQTKARFRECHDRVHNDPELLAEDLTVKDELESLIQDNFRSMQSQMGPLGMNDPNTAAKYFDMKKIRMIKEKNDSGKDSAWGAGSNEMDEDGLNIFYGNRRNYEREQAKKLKINIGKKQKW